MIKVVHGDDQLSKSGAFLNLWLSHCERLYEPKGDEDRLLHDIGLKRAPTRKIGI